MLGLFYNNNINIKKGKENKQPVKPQSFSKLRHTILTLTSIMLGINNPL